MMCSIPWHCCVEVFAYCFFRFDSLWIQKNRKIIKKSVAMLKGKEYNLTRCEKAAR